MVERAGPWRRALAAVVDLLVAQAAVLVVVALSFSATGGRVTTSVPVLRSCALHVVAPGDTALPRGVTLPAGFAANRQGLCRSSLLGAATSVTFVAEREDRQGSTTTTWSYALTPDGAALVRGFDAQILVTPAFVLLRWLLDRFARGSLGRRLTGIAVAEVVAAAKGD